MGKRKNLLKGADFLVDCIFCKIINKNEKAYIIYENEYVCCIFDKYPINKGHILILPKTHYEEFTDVDPKILSHVILAAQKVAKTLETTLHPDGLTIMQNNGVFKDVNHYHMHVFPRYQNDGFAWIEPNNTVSEEEIITLHEFLQKKII